MPYADRTINFTALVAPSWFVNAPERQWRTIPGTATGTLTAAGASGAHVYAWTGMAYDQDRKSIFSVGNGGHGDSGANDGYELSLLGETCAWVKTHNASTASECAQEWNGTGVRGDGSKVADHTYNLPIWAEGKIWWPAIGAMHSAGWSSTACWSWDRTQINNGRLGFTYLGRDAAYVFGGGSPGSFTNSGSAYDPVDRKVWVVPETWRTSMPEHGLRAINLAGSPNPTLEVYSPSDGYSYNCPFALVVHPAKRLLFCVGRDYGSFVMDLTNPGVFLDIAGESGRPINDYAYDHAGVVMHAAANGGGGVMYYWSGGSILRCSVPASITGTYTWSAATGITGTVPAEPADGAYKKFGMIDNFGGQPMLLVVNNESGPVYFMKVPANGL